MLKKFKLAILLMLLSTGLLLGCAAEDEEPTEDQTEQQEGTETEEGTEEEQE